MKIYFYFLTCLLKTRINIMNNFIKKLSIELYLLKDGNEMLHKLEFVLEKIINVYQDITEAGKKLNKIYGIQLLFVFISFLIFTLCNGYVCLYLLTFYGNENNYILDYDLYMCTKHLLFHGFEAILVVKGCYDLCQNVSSILVSFYKN